LPIKLKKKLEKLNPSSKIRTVDPESPDPRIFKEAAEIIRVGGIIIFPTRCLYGLAADAFNPEAVSRIFKIKSRSLSQPILILIKNEGVLESLVQDIPLQAKKLIKKFWPGQLTMIFSAHPSISKILTGNTSKIGIRLPGHPSALDLVSLLDNPITGTSANFSGQAGIADIRNLDSAILDKVDLVLDAGPLLGGKGSTIVDVTSTPCRIIREGVISAEQFRAAIDKT
jgi:L-threonylcarbamoyladenylate synthase